jgi:hypothetical protein
VAVIAVKHCIIEVIPYIAAGIIALSNLMFFFTPYSFILSPAACRMTVYASEAGLNVDVRPGAE